MRGGVSLVCECVRYLTWRQGGMRDCTDCDFYFIGPQLSSKLHVDVNFRELRFNQSCNRLPGMFWISLKGPTTQAIHVFQRIQALCSNHVSDVSGVSGDRVSDVSGDTSDSSMNSFYPVTFVLPREERDLVHYLKTIIGTQAFLLKPSKGSQGKGIVIAMRDQVHAQCIEMSRDGPFIVQQYLTLPHTINGFKYDLRLYVVVTSVARTCVFLLVSFCHNSFCIYIYADLY